MKLEQKELSYCLIAADDSTWGRQIFQIHMREDYYLLHRAKKGQDL